MGLSGLNLASAKSPLPKPRIISNATAEFARVVKEETQEADRLIAETDKLIDSTPKAVPVKPLEENISDDNEKLSRLVDDDFPFDDTQLTAIYGLVQQQYGVMIGAAGTGKTTTTKKLVDMLRDGLDEIDVSQYWTRGTPDEHDDYEIPEKLIPSIAMVSFTGRATQMIKKNFPRDWHGNIMTIHRALGFFPEYYQDLDIDSGQMVGKRRFVPSYTEENQMPWDIIIIDEAGMLGLELWHQLWAATKDSCRIIMIGDINQLPPTHGKSILGFALGNWPTWELTHVHRQQGANNSIVDNAHRILKGLRPVSDSSTPLSLKSNEDMLKALNYLVKDDSWRFVVIEVPEEHRMAALRIRQVLQLVQGKLYEPNRDVLITPTNGFEQTAPGWSLGQEPLNQELVVKLNSANPRYLIDAGREKQNFAVGDKVMATVNDYEAGITNGMTGIVTKIEMNGAYIGDTNRWGLINEVNEYLSGLAEDDDVEFSLEEMISDSQAGMEELKKKEKRDQGPASHVVEVTFGEAEHSFTINFDSKSKVASLMLAYAATCHKMQGGECPIVFGIVHQAHTRLTREWYYTMVTRASQRCIVFTTRMGTGKAIGNMAIKGANLKAKIASFMELTKSGLVGPSIRVKLPQARSLSTESKCNWCGLIHSGDCPPVKIENEVRQTNHEQIKVGSATINLASLEKPKEQQVSDSETTGDKGVNRETHAAVAKKPLSIGALLARGKK
ncbi:MAG: ATP-dependent DNA helicase [Cetobacterium sp.]